VRTRKPPRLVIRGGLYIEAFRENFDAEDLSSVFAVWVLSHPTLQRDDGHMIFLQCLKTAEYKGFLGRFVSGATLQGKPQGKKVQHVLGR